MTLIKRLINRNRDYFDSHPYKAYGELALWSSLVITIICQAMECHSIIEGVSFIFNETYFFVLNYLIVLFTLCLAFIFKRRAAFMILFGTIWIGLGITNMIITIVRPMPLSGIDFVVLTTTMDIIPHYLSVPAIIACVIGILGIILYTAYIIYKSKKFERNIRKCAFPVVGSLALLLLFLLGGMLNNRLEVSYANVKEAYDKYGFIYCFSSSLVDKGIEEPDDYSSSEVYEIVKKYAASEEGIPEETPNIIVVQLESFFDVLKYHKYSLNKDPIPNYHMICKQFGEGGIAVPSNGGGTVNTEFEILTGMNLEFFGAVEYPYTTILKKETCEAAPFILDKYGYKSHAIHNHTGVFYRRNEVYPNLGFDTFTPLEHMQYVDNELGWAKDTAVLDTIIDAIESTDGKDFIFAVTVEGHGMYVNKDRPDIEFKVDNRDLLEGDELKKAYMYEYYCNLLHETDKVIGKLYEYVMSSNEDCVVVLYGDHLPSIEFDSDLYDYKSDYMTSYTVFSNIDNFNYNHSQSIPAYRLLSSVFESVGIDGGIINMINRCYAEEDYENDLEAVQYDMLYGNGYSFGDAPYVAKNIQFGIKEIRINSIVFDEGFMTVNGQNFTKASRISVNGWSRDTEFVDSNTLKCSLSGISAGDIISVRQCAVDGKNLSEAIYIVN